MTHEHYRRSVQQTTIGVDLSTTNAKTALCEIDWSLDPPIATVRAKVGLKEIAETHRRGTLAIDCPFGWPDKFVDFVVSRRNGDRTDASEREPLRLRHTDLWVREQISKTPLSVSADKLGATAMYCSQILDEINPALDRCGADGVIEVYPAASLKVWGHDARDGFDKLVRAAGIELRSESEPNDHCRDAVVCALTARAFDLELIQKPDGGIPAVAKHEGWIFIPAHGSLSSLTARPPFD